jgi:glycosyltransferase involved in cell wall biosynthesis
MTVHLAAVGDVNSQATWSGIPFNMLAAGRALGVLDDGLPLACDGPSWTLRRCAWNVASLLRGSLGGYQYSEAFLSALWRQAALAPGDTIVNCFQLYPQHIAADGRLTKWFCIDQTLHQLFSDYGAGPLMSAGAREEILQREAAQYRAAAGVIAHSEWAADSVRRFYGIDPAKVFTVVAGANLDERLVEAWERLRAAPANGPLRLVFVGKDWRRKGLVRLIEAIIIARESGARISLTVIGPDADEIPQVYRALKDIDWLGPIDKSRDMARFIEIVGAHDAGCLLSKAEAGGIALREFHRLGLATLAPATGGAPEHAIAGATTLIAPSATPRDIAAVLRNLAARPDELQRQKDHAWRIRHSASWRVALVRIGEIMQTHAQTRPKVLSLR